MELMNRKGKLLEMLLQSPEDVFLNYAIAMEYKSEGNLKESISFFEKCIQIQSNHTPSMYQLALIFEEMGDSEKVLSILNTGIEILKTTKDLKSLNEFLSLKEMNTDF
jgi:tetratricopeptide (TPR) repeat protein